MLRTALQTEHGAHVVPVRFDPHAKELPLPQLAKGESYALECTGCRVISVPISEEELLATAKAIHDGRFVCTNCNFEE